MEPNKSKRAYNEKIPTNATSGSEITSTSANRRSFDTDKSVKRRLAETAVGSTPATSASNPSTSISDSSDSLLVLDLSDSDSTDNESTHEMGEVAGVDWH